jgi:hypothetical protein
VVDAVDEHRRAVLRRRGLHDLLGAGVDVLLAGLFGQEEAGALETRSAPMSPQARLAGSRSAVRRMVLPLTIRLLPSTGDVALEVAVHGVVLEHVRQVVGVEQVVDADHFDVGEILAR